MIHRPYLIAVNLVLVVVSVTARAGLPVLTLDLLPVSSTTVPPGGSVNYRIVGQLSGPANEGLALWASDLRASYAIPGGLPRALPGPEMCSFVQPQGFTNPPAPANGDCMSPSGYGGTPAGFDRLLQIGGGQNTIGNPGPIPPFPIGEVVLGIGFDPVVLAAGLVNLPSEPGVYSLQLADAFANTIDFGETVGPIYNVSAATTAFGAQSLSITVVPEPSLAVMVSIGVLFVARRGRPR